MKGCSQDHQEKKQQDDQQTKQFRTVEVRGATGPDAIGTQAEAVAPACQVYQGHHWN